jgi:hypothetical protein
MLSYNAHKAANLIGLMRAIVVGFLQKKPTNLILALSLFLAGQNR